MPEENENPPPYLRERQSRWILERDLGSAENRNARGGERESMFGGPQLLGGVPAGRAWPRDLNAGLRDPWNAGATTPRRRSSGAEGASEREARAIDEPEGKEKQVNACNGLCGGKRRDAKTRETESLAGTLDKFEEEWSLGGEEASGRNF